MSSEDIMVRLTGVSKAFPRYSSPTQRFLEFFSPRPRHDLFHALANIDLELKRGESLGLLGRNGAGKSTLMQIIAKTLMPSSGNVEVNGRLSPLLELGTGFNPEYTGLENLRLNAAILGLSQNEIQQKEPLIVEFADIGEFINQPVKTYSSGMFARLAFAVAIHVDPEILLIDEILAVGDAVFQQKCLSMLKSLRERGLSIVFVSHSADIVKSICDTGIFLEQGQILSHGSASEVADKYFEFMRTREHEQQAQIEQRKNSSQGAERRFHLPSQFRYGSGEVQVKNVEVFDENGQVKSVFEFGDTITVRMSAKSSIEATDISASIVINDFTGTDLFGTTTFDENIDLPNFTTGEEFTVEFQFVAPLRVGSYGVSVSLNRVTDKNYLDNFLYDALRGVAAFSILKNSNRPIHYKVHVPVEIKII